MGDGPNCTETTARAGIVMVLMLRTEILKLEELPLKLETLNNPAFPSLARRLDFAYPVPEARPAIRT